MKIKLNHCFDDWYTVIRVEHDGREWVENPDKNSSRFMCSERLSPEACIEGTTLEMIEVASAIKRRSSLKFKRIAIAWTGSDFLFWSPKNSEKKVSISTEDADSFANEVQEMLEA